MVATCGPELMMVEVLKISKQHNIPAQASLERWMKCGVGICGACALSTYRICKDGPVFDSEKLTNTDFGKSKLDKAGEKCSI